MLDRNACEQYGNIHMASSECEKEKSMSLKVTIGLDMLEYATLYSDRPLKLRPAVRRASRSTLVSSLRNSCVLLAQIAKKTRSTVALDNAAKKRSS